MDKRFIFSALILSLGLAVAGGAIAWGVKLAKQSDHFVTVKGLSERPVVADQGTWNIRFSASGDNRAEAIKQSNIDRKLVLEFLQEFGFSNDEIRPGTPNISEQPNYNNSATRYSVNDSILIISDKVEKISHIARNSSQLLNRGVALSGWENPSYYFTQLGSIKPAMIEEATKDARSAAEKFAADSGSQVGSIRRASQGYFSFNGESSGIPENEQIKKIARVVITVDYLINN